MTPSATKEGPAVEPTVQTVARRDIDLSEWQRPPFSVRARKALSFRNMSAVYLFVVMFVVFSLWIPSTFLTSGTWRSLISDQSITCLVAVGLVPALAAGVFELAVGAEVGLGAIMVAWLLVQKHASVPEAIVLTLLAGALVGVINWVLIVRARIPSFIATLGMSSVLIAVIDWISSSQQILNLPASFGHLGNDQLFGLQLPVYIMLGVAFVVWYFLERTPAGRGVYAAGEDPDAAALAGVRVSRVILWSAMACAVIAGLAGLLESSQLSTGDPTIGAGYLLPAISAVFLGSTQFRAGRMNVWGTVVAAYVIATGVKGLQLAGLPIWIPDLFNGVALLLAVGLATFTRSPISPLAGIRRLLVSSSRSARVARRQRRAEQLARVRAAAQAPAPAVSTAGAADTSGWSAPSTRTRVLRALSFRNISAIYLFVLLFVVFSIWIPNTFLTSGTWRSLASDQAITCLAALALVPVIAAGVVDLAVGMELGLGSILAAALLAKANMPLGVAIALTFLAGAAVGVVNWALITRIRIPPFIATLGVSSVLIALVDWISNSQQILNLPSNFQPIGETQILGLQLPFYIVLGIALVMWYVLERTGAGRRLYATGSDPAAAKLAGIRTSRVILIAAIGCPVIAGAAGMLESAQLATGDPTIGPGFLLPCIAAVFLGSTQFRNGRVNVWGTVIGAYVIATGVKGFQLAGAPIWVPDMFDGVVLIAAVAMAQSQRASRPRMASLRRRLARRPAEEAATS
jgi:ribose/xylose/arabinose/galactoside ABC-type transport system permease subunit